MFSITEKSTPQRKGKILFMDDDSQIRNVVKQLLESAGHTVIPAENGEEAVRKYFEHKELGEPFDLLILDLTVPGGMGGKETMEEIRKKDPDVKAIVSSGYSNDPIMAYPEKYGFSAVIQKPYRINQMLKTIDELLSK
ncbi:MAG TPA: response regulator [candidate division Zixibacteria bacterium]|nr:response regulator [candidate division Zixibacteria bacterium]